MESQNDNERIYDIALGMRNQFIEILESSIGTRDTQGSCIFACALLASAFERFSNYQVACRGGDGDTSGFKDSSGKLHGHYWLAVKTDVCCYIVDITADQFGYPTVIVENEATASAYIPGEQKGIDEHFQEVQQSIKSSSFI